MDIEIGHSKLAKIINNGKCWIQDKRKIHYGRLFATGDLLQITKQFRLYSMDKDGIIIWGSYTECCENSVAIVLEETTTMQTTSGHYMSDWDPKKFCLFCRGGVYLKLMISLLEIIFEGNAARADKTKSYYGSNFQHSLNEYTSETEDGLAKFAVNFSEFNKWGINPSGGYFPNGVYFYYLSKKCESAIGTGFATERKWANIAEINYERMVVLNPGHPRHFSAENLKTAKDKLKKYTDKVVLEGPRKTPRFANFINIIPEFIELASLLSELQDKGVGSFNKLLHEVGYDGIIDYGVGWLPIESCQGVQTWPGGANYIFSIPTPQATYRNISDDKMHGARSPTQKKRLDNILNKIYYLKDGSLVITEEEFNKIFAMLPTFYGDQYDQKSSRIDVAGLLMRKINFSLTNLWDNYRIEDTRHLFYGDLERNPTVPMEFWRHLLHSSDEGARLTAKDKLS